MCRHPQLPLIESLSAARRRFPANIEGGPECHEHLRNFQRRALSFYIVGPHLAESRDSRAETGSPKCVRSQSPDSLNNNNNNDDDEDGEGDWKGFELIYGFQRSEGDTKGSIIICQVEVEVAVERGNRLAGRRDSLWRIYGCCLIRKHLKIIKLKLGRTIRLPASQMHWTHWTMWLPLDPISLPFTRTRRPRTTG